MNLYQTQNSSILNIGSLKNKENITVNSKEFPASQIVNKINSTEIMKPKPLKSDLEEVKDYDGLSSKELKQFVLTMIQRKDELEEKLKRMENKLRDEENHNKGLIENLFSLNKEYKFSQECFETKIQNLESENKLLKEQLKKYVSAVQMIRYNNTNEIKFEELNITIPVIKDELQRDFSYEAEQYEKKLIQVCFYYK